MKFIAGLRVWGNWKIGENVLKVFLRLRGSATRRVDLFLPLIASIPGGEGGTSKAYTLPKPARRQAWPLKIGQLKMPGNKTGRRDGTLQEDAGRVRKGSGPRVMAVLRKLIIDLCSFSGKASPAAANRHGHAATPGSWRNSRQLHRRMKRPWKTGRSACFAADRAIS